MPSDVDDWMFGDPHHRRQTAPVGESEIEFWLSGVEAPFRQPEACCSRTDDGYQLFVARGDRPVAGLLAIGEGHESHLGPVHVYVLDGLVVDEHLQRSEPEEHCEHQLDEGSLVTSCKRADTACCARECLPIEHVSHERADRFAPDLSHGGIGFAHLGGQLGCGGYQLCDACAKCARPVDEVFVDEGLACLHHWWGLRLPTLCPDGLFGRVDDSEAHLEVPVLSSPPRTARLTSPAALAALTAAAAVAGTSSETT